MEKSAFARSVVGAFPHRRDPRIGKDMAKNLLIVESPAKAKTIKKYLGKDFEVMASYGHVRDLVPKEGAVDPSRKFAMRWELIDKNRKHVDAISRAMKKADALYLSTDPDREGEAISWHLLAALGMDGKKKAIPVRRVVFHEITKGAITEAQKQAALNIEDGIENIRYNHVVIATDADVDGMHIRLLMISFFLQFFPDLIKNGHLYILQTPLFRVRNKKKTTYCYSPQEREAAVKELGPNPEITRFKGLGEISPDEFKHFINANIRLEPVTLRKADNVADLLEFYMGKNTPERQDFIIDNLRIEEDMVEEAV